MSRIWFLGGVLAAVGSSATTAAAPADIREEVLVREVQILVDPPRERSVAREGRRPGGLLLEEDGWSRTVAQVDPLSAEHRWEVVVYLDQVMGGSGSATAGARIVSALAADLTALGPVEIVVADPAPQRLLAAGTDPRAVSSALETLVVAGLRAGREAVAANPVRRGGGDADQAFAARRQADRLLAWLGPRGRSVPRLLVLTVDGVLFSPRGLNAAAGQVHAGAPPAEAAWLAATEETARALAALGWTVAILTTGTIVADPLPDLEDDFDRYRRTQDEARLRDAPPTGLDLLALGRLLTGKGPRALPRLGDAVDLGRAPLRPYAVASGGAVVGDQLEALLASLRERWVVSYQSPAPRDGGLHRVTVRAADGRDLTAPCCVGAGLEAVTAARLRLLLAGERPVDGVPLEAVAWRAGRGSRGTSSGAVAAGSAAGEAVHVEFATGPAAATAAVDAAAPATVRIAVAFVGLDGVPVLEMRDWRPTDPGRAREVWTLAVPAAVRKLAITVEDLTGAAWSGGVEEIASGPSGEG